MNKQQLHLHIKRARFSLVLIIGETDKSDHVETFITYE